MVRSNKINIIDLFSGCGGLSDGFEQTERYHMLACVDWERPTCQTLIERLNSKWGYVNASNIVMHFDIQKTDQLISGWTDDEIYGSGVGLDNIISGQQVDMIIGGPPCQAYSIAGRIRDDNNMENDYRNYLFESYIKVVNHYRPKLFVFENVPGLLSAKPGGVAIIDRITEAFTSIGYEITSDLRNDALIDCTNFGVPQARKRIIIVGVNKNELDKHQPSDILLDFYRNILPKYYSTKKTVADAIKDLPKIYPISLVDTNNRVKKSHSQRSEIEVHNHIPRKHSYRDIEIFKMLASDIENGINKYGSSESLKELYHQYTGKQSNIHKYHVLRWNKPSNTIPAHLYKDGLRHIHPDPEQARTITVREAARLQSFDDEFVFMGSMTDQYKMIGNAVPPKFAKAIASAIVELITKYF